MPRRMNPPALIATLLAMAVASAAPAVEDPTRPPSPAEIRAWFGDAGDPSGAEPALRLQSVLISESRRVAIINDRRVGPGERVAGAKITAIEPGRVVLERDGETLILTISSRRQPLGR